MALTEAAVCDVTLQTSDVTVTKRHSQPLVSVTHVLV